MTIELLYVFWTWIKILYAQEMLSLKFGAFLPFPARYSIFHSSEGPWCRVAGTEVTCGGSGGLTSGVVRGAGAYTKYRRAVVLEGISALRSSCFASCNGLQEIELATTVSRIENMAFDGCSLSAFRLHFNLTSMASGAFNNQRKLMSIEVDDSNPNYCSHDGMLLTKDKKTVVIIPGGWKSCAIPASVTHLSDGCCKWSLMETLDIPDNVVSIGKDAFYMNTQLTSISIGSGLVTFAPSAIDSCSNLNKIDLDSRNANFYNENGVFGGLGASGVQCSIIFISKDTESITVQSSITEIGPTVFQNAEELCEIQDEGGNFTSPDTKILVQSNTLLACGGGVESVEIPDTITEIVHNAFRLMKKLKSVVFGRNVMSIGMSVFRDCEQLTYFDWNGCLAELIPTHMFTGVPLTVMDTFTVPSSVKMIDQWGFAHAGLRSINVSNVETINNEAFVRCKKLEFVYLPKVIYIGPSAFRECSALQQVIFGTPSTLQTIGSMAFMHCTNLASIDIPETLTNLIPESFGYCSSLTTVNVETSSYKSVDGVVYNRALTSLILCPPGLETITLISTTKTLGSNSFYGCSKLSSVFMNDGIERLESWAFTDCNALATIVLPSGITYIAPDALSGCPNLKRVFYCNTNDVSECGTLSFSAKTEVYVSENYESSDGLFCHHECMKVLDSHCNIPTQLFTQWILPRWSFKLLFTYVDVMLYSVLLYW